VLRALTPGVFVGGASDDLRYLPVSAPSDTFGPLATQLMERPSASIGNPVEAISGEARVKNNAKGSNPAERKHRKPTQNEAFEGFTSQWPALFFALFWRQNHPPSRYVCAESLDSSSFQFAGG